MGIASTGRALCCSSACESVFEITSRSPCSERVPVTITSVSSSSAAASTASQTVVWSSAVCAEASSPAAAAISAPAAATLWASASASVSASPSSSPMNGASTA